MRGLNRVPQMVRPPVANSSSHTGEHPYLRRMTYRGGGYAILRALWDAEKSDNYSGDLFWAVGHFLLFLGCGGDWWLCFANASWFMLDSGMTFSIFLQWNSTFLRLLDHWSDLPHGAEVLRLPDEVWPFWSRWSWPRVGKQQEPLRESVHRTWQSGQSLEHQLPWAERSDSPHWGATDCCFFWEENVVDSWMRLGWWSFLYRYIFLYITVNIYIHTHTHFGFWQNQSGHQRKIEQTPNR